MLSNEPSWSSFGHREGLQMLAAKQAIFPVLGLCVCTSATPLYLGVVPLPGVIEKYILNLKVNFFPKLDQIVMLEVIFAINEFRYFSLGLAWFQR